MGLGCFCFFCLMCSRLDAGKTGNPETPIVSDKSGKKSLFSKPEDRERGNPVRQNLLDTSCLTPSRCHGRILNPTSTAKAWLSQATTSPTARVIVGRISSPLGDNSFCLSLPPSCHWKSHGIPSSSTIQQKQGLPHPAVVSVGSSKVPLPLLPRAVLDEA